MPVLTECNTRSESILVADKHLRVTIMTQNDGIRQDHYNRLEIMGHSEACNEWSRFRLSWKVRESGKNENAGRTRMNLQENWCNLIAKANGRTEIFDTDNADKKKRNEKSLI